MDINIWVLVVWGIFLWVAGYAVSFSTQQSKKRLLAWFLVILTTIGSVLLSIGLESLYRMFIIVSLQLIAMKPIVLVESYPNQPKLRFLQWSAFALGWFGMRPTLFENFPSKRLNKTSYFFVKGSSRVIFGLGMLYGAQYIPSELAGNLVRLVGISFILHFGILNISTGFLRMAGVDVKELFIAPYKSKSLKEFWGRRWNMAFSEMTALIAYKPLKGRLGIHAAMFISFLFSGILHEIAISFPVESGYGLPLLYFLIHGIVMQAESKWAWIKKITTQPILSRFWVYFWLIIPMPLLFHEKFIEGVVNPLTNIILQPIHSLGF